MTEKLFYLSRKKEKQGTLSVFGWGLDYEPKLFEFEKGLQNEDLLGTRNDSDSKLFITENRTEAKNLKSSLEAQLFKEDLVIKTLAND